MTAYSELKLREEARQHDITDPSATLRGPELAKRAVYRKVLQVRVEADAAAGTTIAERSVLAFPASQFPNGAEVKEIKLRTSAAVTESTSVYATDTFTQRDSLGVNNLSAATLTTNTVANAGIGTTVAHKEYSATLSGTLANLQVPAGGVLTLTRAKASTGTQMPECVYTVVVEAL